MNDLKRVAVNFEKTSAYQVLADLVRETGIYSVTSALEEIVGRRIMVTQVSTASCEWQSDPDGFWSTQCGKDWVFEVGGPVENEMRYCPICGKVLFIADEPAEDAEAACDECGHPRKLHSDVFEPGHPCFGNNGNCECDDFKVATPALGLSGADEPAE